MSVRLSTSAVLCGIIICCCGIFYRAFSGSDAGMITVCAAEKDTVVDINADAETDFRDATDNEGITADAANVDNALCIVIDPGHGGENLGGEYEDYTEKEMTMVVAKAMKEELEKYEGVNVYLTRDGDQELSLEERCEYAESVNADFLFCLHFNLSEYHTLFGAECWVSAFGENYSKGYQFASVEMELLQELGLYSRGIKTRLNSRGLDYYGIIRHATEREIPCVLIEHCHLDQDNDKPFYDHDEKLKAFGRLDATAVAKYFHLSSGELGVDYTEYQNPEVDVPTDVVEPDHTEPDFCTIEILEQNADNGEITVQVSAKDQDSGMLYYAYSYDGGEVFSELMRWPDRSSDTFSFTIQVPPREVPRIVVNGYNGYDLYTASNMISLPAMDYKTPEEIAAEAAGKEALESISIHVNLIENMAEDSAAVSKKEKTEYDRFMIDICAACVLLAVGMTVAMIMILRGRNRKRRLRRKKSRRRRH